jgi:hypothetical protein
LCACLREAGAENLSASYQVHAEHEEREAELNEYYSMGSQYGVPASVILFQLAHSMQLGRSYLLWYVSNAGKQMLVNCHCLCDFVYSAIAKNGFCLCRMAILGLTEQFMLNRANEAVPHYVSCLEMLENYAEAMNVSERQQELFGEGFEDDEDARYVEEGAMSSKACQGRIQYVSSLAVCAFVVQQQHHLPV